jgi:hypothetical protein
MERTAQICSIPDLVTIAVSAYKEVRGDIWWRGHACHTWKLTAGVYREEYRDHGHRYEKNVVKRFMMRAPTRHECLPRTDDHPA